MNKNKRFSMGMIILYLIISFNLNAQTKSDIIRDILKEKIKNSNSTLFSPDDQSASLRTDFETKVSENTVNDEAEPYIIVNPEDSTHLLISYINLPFQSMDFPIYYSHDAGETWNKSNFSTEAIFQAEPFSDYNISGGGDPVFAFDHEGNIFFSWVYLGINFATFDSRFISFWAKSEDGGETWTVSEGDKKYIEIGSIDLNAGLPGNFGGGVLDRPWFDIDRSGGPYNGTLYTSGFFFPSPNTANDTTIQQTAGMIIKRKLVDADSFELIRTQVSQSDFAQFGNVKVANNGNVHITFGNLITNEVKHSLSSDGGLSFSTPSTMGTFSFGQNGQPLVNDRENPAMNLALDYSNNNLYAVWNSLDNELNGFFTYSHDEGQTWVVQQSIAGLAGAPDQQVFMPNIASNKNNEISISWYSLDAEDEGYYMIMHSRDGGLIWEAPIPLSSSPTDFKNYIEENTQVQAPTFGDYYTSVKVGCKTFSVWSDGRELNGPKIYVSSTDFCNVTTNIVEITPITDKIQVKSIYPNPSNGEFSLELDLKEKTSVKVEIYDASGKLIKSYSERNLLLGKTIEVYDVFALPPSNYLVVINSSLGKITRKLIKQ